MKKAIKLAIEAMQYADACLKKQLNTKGKHEYAQDLLLEASKALEEVLAKQEQGEPWWLLESTQEVAKAMAKAFYPEVTQWKVLDDLAGVISQIDNMTTGLIRKPKQEQGEPVAWVCNGVNNTHDIDFDENEINDLPIGTLLYTTPQPKREPLTDEQIRELFNEHSGYGRSNFLAFARAIEAAHGITSDMKQEHVDKTAKQRHEENT